MHTSCCGSMRSHWCVFALAIGCSSPTVSGIPSTDAVTSDAVTSDAPDCSKFISGPIGGTRPVSVYVPKSYTCAPMPLVFLLHGYTGTGARTENYVKLTAQAEARGFLYAYPDGTKDVPGNQFWNAIDACCNYYGSTVDDATYLSNLITEIGYHYNVDRKRVFLVGLSNGGSMSYRMACDHADQIAAIASLAGGTYADSANCKPTQPVAVLHIHGTADSTASYGGSTIGGRPIAGAIESVTDWATFGGCSNTPDNSSLPLDLDTGLAGNETTVTRYGSGCRPGGHAELWTIVGGEHNPMFSPSFAPTVVDFLLSHAKP